MIFNSVFGLYGNSTQIVEITVFVGNLLQGRASLSSTTSTPLLCVGVARMTAPNHNATTTHSFMSRIVSLSLIIKSPWKV